MQLRSKIKMTAISLLFVWKTT